MWILARMDNRYKAPEAVIRDTETLSKKRWKVFAWVILLLEILSVSLQLSMPEETFIEVMVELVIYASIILGLFGFAYNKRFMNRPFWMLLIPVGLLYDTSLEGYIMTGIFVVFGLIPAYFQYLALYKYSARSSHIWT